MWSLIAICLNKILLDLFSLTFLHIKQYLRIPIFHILWFLKAVFFFIIFFYNAHYAHVKDNGSSLILANCQVYCCCMWFNFPCVHADFYHVEKFGSLNISSGYSGLYHLLINLLVVGLFFFFIKLSWITDSWFHFNFFSVYLNFFTFVCLFLLNVMVDHWQIKDLTEVKCFVFNKTYSSLLASYSMVDWVNFLSNKESTEAPKGKNRERRF